MVRSVWVICRDANAVLRFDPRKLRVTQSVRVDAPTVASSSSGALWVGTDTRVLRFDVRSLRRIATFPDLAPGYSGDLTIAPDGVWVRTERSFLSRIDLKSNQVVEQIRPPAPLPGGSALYFAGALWTDASDANQAFPTLTELAALAAHLRDAADRGVPEASAGRFCLVSCDKSR